MRPMTRTITILGGIVRPRFVALSAIAALVGTSLLAVPASAASTTSPAAEKAAQWLDQQLIGDLLYAGAPQFEASTDAALSFARITGHEATGDAIVGALSEVSAESGPGYLGYMQPNIYAGEAGFQGQEFRAHATAKTAMVASRMGLDIENFVPDAGNPGNDVNLVEEIEDLINVDTRMEAGEEVEGYVSGRIEDHYRPSGGEREPRNGPDDKADVAAQAWAVEVLRLAAADSPNDDNLDYKAQRATLFLRAQQCPGPTGGYFRANFTTGKFADDQACVTGGFNSDPNNLVTAQVLLALDRLVDTLDPAVDSPLRAMLSNAVTYLVRVQKTSGGFSLEKVGDPDAAATAMAGLALYEAGYPAQARNAAMALRRLQVFDPEPCPGFPGDADGAVAANSPAYELGKAAGIGGVFSWSATTALSLPLLSLMPRTVGSPTITGPTGFVHSGTSVTLRASNLEPGERVCVSGLKLTRLITAREASTAVPTVAPAGTANRVFTIASMEGARSLILKVLDKKTLSIKAKKKVKRNKKMTFTVSGLAPGETVIAKVKNKTVAKGTANSKGVFTKKFKVKAPKGTASIKVWGHFKDRFGQKQFKVR